MLNFASKTDIGKIKEKNEDYIKLPDTDLENIKKLGYLFILCDGVGGYPKGEIASRKTAEIIHKKYYSLKEFPKNPINELKKIIESVNNLILEENSNENEKKSTTLVLSLIKDEFAYFCSVGDSRGYIFTKNYIQQKTEDHSPVWRRYKSGKINKNEILEQVDKNRISQAIGFKKELKIYSNSTKLKKFEKILLCSDGISDYLTDLEILLEINRSQNLEKMCSNMIEKINNLGGLDNISLITIENLR